MPENTTTRPRSWRHAIRVRPAADLFPMNSDDEIPPKAHTFFRKAFQLSSRGCQLQAKLSGRMLQDEANPAAKRLV